MRGLAARLLRRRVLAGAAALIAALAATAVSRPSRPAPQWHEVSEPLGRWSARFPGAVETRLARHPQTGLSGMEVAAAGDASCRVLALPVLFDQQPLPEAAGALESHLNAAGWATRTAAVAFAGELAYRIDARRGKAAAAHLVLEHRDMRIWVSASGEHAQAFLISFRWTDGSGQESDRMLANSSP